MGMKSGVEMARGGEGWLYTSILFLVRVGASEFLPGWTSGGIIFLPIF